MSVGGAKTGGSIDPSATPNTITPVTTVKTKKTIETTLNTIFAPLPIV
jgi:hypothetical protein